MYYQWQFNGVNIAAATNSTLILSNVQVANAGIYEVLVSNDSGTIPSTEASLGLLSTVIAWGDNRAGQTNVPMGLVDVQAIGTGGAHTLALMADGGVTAWGANGYGQTDLPPGLSNAVAVAAGDSHSMALKSDGTIVCWGNNNWGQTTVPLGLSNVLAIACGAFHNLALQPNGAVMGWGNDTDGQIDIPTGVSDIVAISGGYAHSLALRQDGTVFAWGYGEDGETVVPNGLGPVKGISAGWYHNLALRNDGTVAAWGDNSFGQINVPVGLSNVVAVAAGGYHSLALRNDGNVVVWGTNSYGQATVPPTATNAMALAGGCNHSVALVSVGSNGWPRILRQPINVSANVGMMATFSIAASGALPLNYQWRLNGDNLPGATAVILALTNLQTTDGGGYDVVVSNGVGSATSDVAVLIVDRLEILAQPSDRWAFPGGSVTFSVGAVSAGILRFQWEKDGTAISGATNADLTIANVQATDAGIFRVAVRDAFRSLESAGASLRVTGTPIIVSSSADAGPGTLRTAINQANAQMGMDAIVFNIQSAGVQSIAPATPLPAIIDALVIDGYTQPGATSGKLASPNVPTLLIQLTGTNTVTICSGLDIMASNCVIRGLIVNGFGASGLTMRNSASGCRIQGNYIGVDATGTIRSSNGLEGVYSFGPGNLIGGKGPGEGNVISGNALSGVRIDASANQVLGNFIGTDITGTNALGNLSDGVTLSDSGQNSIIGGANAGSGNLISGNGANGVSIWSGSSGNVVQGNLVGVDVSGLRALQNTNSGVSLECPSNLVGGATVVARNILSGNGLGGIQLNGLECSNNVIQGNYIGADISGTKTVGNGEEGILLWAGPGNVIGGRGPGEGNIIAGNHGIGIRVYLGAQWTRIQGNSVGTDIMGAMNLGNWGPGIYIADAEHSVVGGTAPGEGNRVYHNGGAGIRIGPGTNNAMRANSIFGNGALGIDLGGDGVTANHVGGPIRGANEYQNYPVLMSAVNGTNIAIEGTLNSAAGTAYQLDFFGNDAPDASGYGQGQVYIGSVAVTTDGSGSASFTFSPTRVIPPGHWITATATDPWGNTSEFCAAVPVGSSLDILVQPASQVVSPGASAIFSVNARGVRPLTYQWQKDGVVLSGATNASLTITNIQANDAGTYWVVVSDASGSVTSTPAILSVAAAPVAIVVTNSADSGPGSLREAINAANNTLGSVQITFRIAGAGVRTIAPQTPLPALTTPIEIDGYSQPGAAPGQLASTNLPILLIQLTGTNTVTVCDGLDIMTSNCVIRGLVVNSFGGVGVGLLSGAAGSRIEGNYIGTDAGGGLAIGNHGGGVTVGGGAQSSIGGTVVGSGNLISGNGADGISVWSGSSSNVFQGNLIGVDATGLRGLKNTYSGISFRCAGNIVGGEAAGARNILSGNGFGGIQLNGVECSNNVIQGNFIGADITGTNAVGNGEEGILLWAGSDNVIGGSAPGEGNVILGNNGSGIRVYLGAQQTTIEGNSVGTDLTGTINLGNRGPGIEIDDAYDSVIGGAAPGEGNRVWYNTGAGIRIGPGTNNAVRANSIFGNGALGIDLGGDGVTPNHVGGSVPGGNQYQNYPVLAKAINASVTTIYGTLNSATNTAYQLDFFSSDAPDPSGYGQGQVYLGSIAVATDGSGNASFTFSSLSMIPLGRWITSTATDPFGNTSEFCQAVQVVSSLAILIEPRSQFVSPGASVTFSVSALGVGSLTYQWQKDGVALSGATNVSLTVTNIQANDAGAYRVVVSDASASVTSTPAILSVAAAPVAIIVTNAADSGPGSLREAINAANNTLGSVQITFRIAGAGVKTIAPQAPLPALTTPIEIDGYSQPGASPGQLGSTNLPTLLIQLTGTNTVAVCDGLDIMTSNCVLRGLVVNGFGQAGVGLLSGAMGSRIEGNYIGTGPGGGLAIGNRGDGVVLSSGTQNSIVGGTDAGAGNLVSGNGGNGIAIWGGSTENLIQGNLIGSDVSGRTALTNAYSGVALAGSGNTVGGLSAAARNLISGNAWSGVRIDAAMNQVLGNYIGTDITGTNALGNLSDGVTISGGSQNSRIGGTIAGSGNLISGNGANGVSAWSGSSGNIVQGNLVGVDVSGLRALKNTNSGVSLECASNVVGGEAAGARNILSGNGLGGIQLNGLECSNNVIQGNFIGADITGTNAVGNGEEGILLWAGIGNVIGGSGAGQGNVIVGNHGNGLVVYLNARGTRFMGNSVGTDLSGTVPMGNLGPGLTVADAHESLIGGTAAGEGNRLAYNGGAGIAIGPGTNNAVRGNSIFANGALGIDLGEDGVTPNHVGGPIPGANQYQNYPVLTSVLIGTNTAVQGTLNSAANSTYQLDFFSNDVPDPSGYGEGQTYLGSSAVTTDGNGNAAFTFNPATSVSLGNWVTATATDPVGNTSEFSQAVQVSSLQPVITQQPTNQTIFSGGMATFSVSVKGVPPFSYQWRLNGTDLTGAFGSILLVTNAQISDAGAYSVIMSNGFGWVVSSNAWLTVNNAKPFFQASPASQATYPGGTAIFQARVDGSRPFSYQWYRDSSPIAGATNSALVVSNAIANQGGITLVASNQFGSVTSDSAGITLVTVAAWGLNDYGQGTMTPDLTNVVAVSCGFNHSLVLRQDGTVKAWGRDLEGQCDPPPGLTNVAAISAGAYFSLALKKDGTVVGWGDNQYGQLNGIGALTAIQSLSAGLYHCVAVRSNGTVVAWGRDDFGQVDVPSGLTNIISVSGGYRHSLALRANGTVVAWGSDLYGACDVPVGLSNVVAIVAGRTTSLALRSDGTLQGWSTDLVEEMNIPLGLSNVVAVEGYNCIVAIKNDGTLVAWGYDAYAQTNVPVNLRDVISATSKSYFCLALVRLPGTLILSRPSVVGGRFLCMVVTEKGKSYTLEYKNSLSQPTWTPVITISGDGTQKTLTDASASGKQRFYRVEEW